MKQTLVVIFAAAAAVAVHLLILMFGGALVTTAPMPKPTEVRDVELRSARAPSDEVKAAKAERATAPEPQKAPEEEEPESEEIAEATKPSPVEPPVEPPAKQPEASKTEHAVRTEELPAAEVPVNTEVPKQPEATSAKAVPAAPEHEEPVNAQSPIAAAALIEQPTQLASAQARDANVMPSEVDAMPATVPAPVLAPAPVPVPVPPPVPAMTPPQPVRSPSVFAPRRIGPAWNEVASRIGPVPPSLIAAPMPVHPRRRREIAPVDIAAVTMRTHVPYRPLNLGGREPVPSVSATIPPAAPSTVVGRGAVGGATGSASGTSTGSGGQVADRGVLASGAPTRAEPVARIAWGGAEEAWRTLDIGRMQLVAVDEDLKIVAGLATRDGRWVRTDLPAQMGSYSNRVRVVDHVAGFAEQALLCGAGEHLAVIVPVGLDRRIEKAMDQAARREGLSRNQVAACYGRLAIQPTGIEFQIERVERRMTP
jgi:hypothetical protein